VRRISATGSGTKAGCAGFTLIELLVVLAILVLVASAFPVVLNRALPGRRVSAAADKLVCAVREMESLSVTSGQPIHRKLNELAASLPASTHVSMTNREGRAIDSLAVFPDGSTSGAYFEIIDGVHRKALVVSELTGRTILEPRDP